MPLQRHFNKSFASSCCLVSIFFYHFFRSFATWMHLFIYLFIFLVLFLSLSLNPYCIYLLHPSYCRSHPNLAHTKQYVCLFGRCTKTNGFFKALLLFKNLLNLCIHQIIGCEMHNIRFFFCVCTIK